MKLSKNLIAWFDQNRRDLPWRKNVTAYHIWVSEVMLQQTQVSQVIPYFLKFIDRFPGMSDLAAASLDEVLKVWAGMGYYSRARNMHRAAGIMVDNYDGHIPADRSQLIKLPGFGPYITNAVLSLAFNQPYAVMDGNVIRVISRVYGIDRDIRLKATQIEIDTIVQQLIDRDQPGKFNEAMMELGATICLPRSAQCGRCPLIGDCYTQKNGLTGQIPFKSKKPDRPQRTSNCFILTYSDQVLLVKRPPHGLLGGLWEFPACLAEENNGADDPQKCLTDFQVAARFVKSWHPIHHAYTHFHLKLIPNWYRLEKPHFYSDFYEQFVWADWDALDNYPMHRAMQKTVALTLNEFTQEFKSHNQATDK